MSSNPYKYKRCRYCTLFLRTKSTPIPEDKQGVQRLGPVATGHAEAALAALNARQAALNSDLPALSFDDTVFADRLHYRDGKSCYNVVSKSSRRSCRRRRRARSNQSRWCANRPVCRGGRSSSSCTRAQASSAWTRCSTAARCRWVKTGGA